MIKRISILITSTIGLYALWLLVMEKIYAQLLKFGASIILAPFPNVNPILKLDQAHPYFCVIVGPDGYCMDLELFSLSIIVILSWYMMLVALNRSKSMILTSLKHIGIFYLLQILTMSTLALYDFGTIFQQVNNILRQSFIIIALVFIIWDNYLYGIFKFEKKS